MLPELYTLKGLATQTGWTERRIANLLAKVPPDGERSGRKAWLIRTLMKAASGQLGDGGETLNPAAERARLDKARADKTEAELAKLRAELVPASEVDGLWLRIIARFRTVVLTVPGSVASKLRPGMTPSEIEALIREAINSALAELSSTEVESEDE